MRIYHFLYAEVLFVLVVFGPDLILLGLVDLSVSTTPILFIAICSLIVCGKYNESINYQNPSPRTDVNFLFLVSNKSSLQHDEYFVSAGNSTGIMVTNRSEWIKHK